MSGYWDFGIPGNLGHPGGDSTGNGQGAIFGAGCGPLLLQGYGNSRKTTSPDPAIRDLTHPRAGMVPAGVSGEFPNRS